MTEPLQQDDGTSLDTSERLKHYLRILLKRKWNVLLVLALALGGMVLFHLRQVPIYRAVSKVLIADTPPRVLSGVKEVIELGTSGYWTRKEYFKTQCDIIGGAEVAERVVEALQLRANDAFMGRKDDDKSGDAGDPVRKLMGKIEVQPLKDSWVVEIHVEDPDRTLAQDIANAVAREYTQYNLDMKKRIVLDAQRDLFRMVQQLGERKREAEEDLYAFERDNNIGTFENQKRAIDSRLQTLRNRLDEVTIRRAELQAKLRQMRKFDATEDPFDVAYADILQSPLVMEMKRKLIEKRDALSDLLTTYLDRHPKVVAVRNQTRQLTTNLKKEIRGLIQAVEGQHREVAELESSLEAAIEEAKQQEDALNRIRINYEPIQQRVAETRKFYDRVKNRQTETQLSAQSETNNVRVYELAALPTVPARPNVRMNALIAVLFGLLGGVGLALLREFLDNAVRNSDDIERLCGLTYLGAVPLMRESRRGERAKDQPPIRLPDLFVHYRPRSTAAESVRTIRTNLLFTSPDRPLRNLMVTSPQAREGKTAVSINLAIAMAQGGARTLLVDTDLRRPRLHRALGLRSDKGVSNYLIGNVSVDDLVQPTEVPNLFLLPRGAEPPNPTELLHTARFRDLLEELRQKFDVAVFDSPPVLPVSDAVVIASQADGVVLVARHDETARQGLAQARRELERGGARLLGAVLNGLDFERRGYGYHGYYRHRYGYGEASANAAAEKPLL